MRPLRVLLADDHSILRAGIRALLESLPGVTVVAEAADGREALTRAVELRPDLVFMDIGMKGLNGLEATAQLRQELPEVRIIILSMHAAEEYVGQALRAGANGYLLKDAAPAEVGRAVEAVARGETFLTGAVSRSLAEQFAGRSGPAERITPRQREILQLLAEGKSTKEIARLLGISTKTVETHRAQLMERLDIHDLASLVRYALRTGLTQPDV